MPSLVVLGLRDSREEDKEKKLVLRNLLDTLPVHRNEVVIVFPDSDVYDANGIPQPYIIVSGSIEMTEEDIITIANHFIHHIDVEVYSPRWGVKVFKPKWQEIPKDAFKSVEYAETSRRMISMF